MNVSQPLQVTPLTSWHRSHGGRMVPFAGYDMPVQYAGLMAEHLAVRERVGIFDISHMGEIAVSGASAEKWLDGLVTNRLGGIAPGKVVYTAICRPAGGVLDDMLVYRLGPQQWYIVCNAVNRVKIWSWLAEHRPPSGVTLADRSDETALIAVQGPWATELMQRLEPCSDRWDDIAALRFYTATTCQIGGAPWIISRTGYTGERGYEVYLPSAAALPLWEELIRAGNDLGVVPVGLGARDTLRFEVGYCLYGHELSEEISPLEAGIGWAVKLDKEDFTGRAALLEQKSRGIERRLIGVEVFGRAIARQDAAVLAGGDPVGKVTSGTYSPTLQRSLALALVKNSVADPDAAPADLQVEIRGKIFSCRRVKQPFLEARVKGDPRAERGQGQILRGGGSC